MLADVAGAGGAEHRIGDGVADDVGIGMAESAPVARNAYAAEKQRPSLDQPVQIVAGADAHHRRTAVRRRRATARDRLRSSSLKFSAIALDHVNPVPGLLRQRRFVRRVDAGPAERHRARRRRGGTPAASAPDKSSSRGMRLRDERAARRRRPPLDRVARRQRGDRGAGFDRGIDRALDQRRARRTAAPHRGPARRPHAAATRSNAFATDPAASLRRRRHAVALPARSRSLRATRRPASGGSTTTISVDAIMTRRTRSRCAGASRRPPISSNCFGTPAPSRRPSPAAAMMAVTCMDGEGLDRGMRSNDCIIAHAIAPAPQARCDAAAGSSTAAPHDLAHAFGELARLLARDAGRRHRRDARSPSPRPGRPSAVPSHHEPAAARC